MPNPVDAPSIFPSVTQHRVAIDELDRNIVSLCRKINQANYALLVLIREFDERCGWLQWGNTNCAEWLHWRCDLSIGAARERVRMAHALKSLPAIADAFESGALSYSKVRALTRVASPQNEAELLAFAHTTTASRVEERCRQIRNAQPESRDDANRAHATRRFSSWHDHERGIVVLTVELPLERAEVLLSAVDKAVEAGTSEDGPSPSGMTGSGVMEGGPEFGSVTWSAQRADALVEIASAYLDGTAPRHRDAETPDAETDVSAEISPADAARAARSSAERYQVVVHVDRSALDGGGGRSDLPIESIRRLLCDGSVVEMESDAHGEPLNIGRKRRTIPTALRRALWARDRGCSFPGCTHTHFVDAHHVQHWSAGGETSISNTMLLCSAHHRLVHEGGFQILKDRHDRWYFRRPDGRAVPHVGCPADTTQATNDTKISAEIYPTSRVGPSQVREISATYRVCGRSVAA